MFKLNTGYGMLHLPSGDQSIMLLLTKSNILEQGNFSFYEKTWKGITNSAKQLISDLLIVDPSRRPSAQDVLYTLTNFINLKFN